MLDLSLGLDAITVSTIDLEVINPGFKPGEFKNFSILI